MSGNASSEVPGLRPRPPAPERPPGRRTTRVDGRFAAGPKPDATRSNVRRSVTLTGSAPSPTWPRRVESIAIASTTSATTPRERTVHGRSPDEHCVPRGRDRRPDDEHHERDREPDRPGPRCGRLRPGQPLDVTAVLDLESRTPHRGRRGVERPHVRAVECDEPHRDHRRGPTRARTRCAGAPGRRGTCRRERSSPLLLHGACRYLLARGRSRHARRRVPISSFPPSGIYVIRLPHSHAICHRCHIACRLP